jgi:hypothetical protein
MKQSPQLSSPQIRGHSWLMIRHTLSSFRFFMVAGHGSFARHSLPEGEGEIALRRPPLGITRRAASTRGFYRCFSIQRRMWGMEL